MKKIILTLVFATLLISCKEETTEKVTNLIDAITNIDDVQAVYHNIEKKKIILIIILKYGIIIMEE